jgi:hypothetical protein
MNYSLGNMLGGGGSLNADGLSLDLQFAADKSLTARKGPTPVFTRASTATFVGSDGLIQSAAINAARFDHDPITLACKGLLIEESRTNILTGNSQNLSGSGWTGLGLANNDPLIADPRGTVGGVYYVSVNERICSFNGSGTVMCLSFFAKQRTGGGTGVTIQVFQNTSPSAINLGSQLFLFTGAMTPATNFTSLTRTEYPNGWYRFSAVLTAPSGSFNSSARIDIEGAISSNYTWGFQVEAGAFATSYIPTTTGSVVRSADLCSITGSDFTGMYNASEGTMLVNAFTPANGDRTVFSADDNTANEMIRLRTEGTNPFFKVTDGGSDLVAIDAGAVVANTPFKLAGAYKLNDFASSINGGAAVTDTSGTIPTVDRMRIGAGQAGNTMCGCIVSARYFKKRLDDAKLATITT